MDRISRAKFHTSLFPSPTLLQQQPFLLDWQPFDVPSCTAFQQVGQRMCHAILSEGLLRYSPEGSPKWTLMNLSEKKCL